MAKAKSPKTNRTKSQKKNGEVVPVNGAAVSPPVAHAEKVATELTSQAIAGTSVPKEVPVTKEVEPLPSAAADLEAAIRQRAYQLYLERRGAPGNPSEDWARAEREVLEAFQHQKSA